MQLVLCPAKSGIPHPTGEQQGLWGSCRVVVHCAKPHWHLWSKSSRVELQRESPLAGLCPEEGAADSNPQSPPLPLKQGKVALTGQLGLLWCRGAGIKRHGQFLQQLPPTAGWGQDSACLPSADSQLAFSPADATDSWCELEQPQSCPNSH